MTAHEQSLHPAALAEKLSDVEKDTLLGVGGIPAFPHPESETMAALDALHERGFIDKKAMPTGPGQTVCDWLSKHRTFYGYECQEEIAGMWDCSQDPFGDGEEYMVVSIAVPRFVVGLRMHPSTGGIHYASDPEPEEVVVLCIPVREDEPS